MASTVKFSLENISFHFCYFLSHNLKAISKLFRSYDIKQSLQFNRKVKSQHEVKRANDEEKNERAATAMNVNIFR